MKNSVSEQSFYIESEEDDEEKDLNRGGDGEDNANQSDSDDDSIADNQQQSKPGSYTTSWPQSYRQSIDLYSSVPSPSMIMGTPTLSRLGSSFLTSSLIRRHTPESVPSVSEPFLKGESGKPQSRQSSHILFPPVLRKSSIRKDERQHGISHEIPISRHSSYGHAVLNGMNVLCGVGILSTPYAVKEGGWLGLIVLLVFALLSFYTGVLLRHCLESEPGLETYPDIGQAAFGTAGRIAISIILYVELYEWWLGSNSGPYKYSWVPVLGSSLTETLILVGFYQLLKRHKAKHQRVLLMACCVEYIILESDNLSAIFPHAHISFGGLELDAHLLFALMTTLMVLPTVWLRDLSVLSIISAGGVVASLVVVLCLFWVGIVDQVGIHDKGTVLNLGTLPVAIGLYGFCYSGHAVFPNIYTSMAKPNQFNAVLITCFVICTTMYGAVAFMGYTMFGGATESQFTLNLPKDLVASKVAVWTTVVNPFTKYALTLSPVAMSLEELIPSEHMKSGIYSICIRTALVISTLLVGLAVPFFGLVLSLIGSLLTMLVTLILPCLCYLSIVRNKVTKFQVAFCVVTIAIGMMCSAFGSYSALTKIIESLRR